MRKRSSRASSGTATTGESYTTYFGCKRHSFRTCEAICEGRVAARYHGCVTCKQLRAFRKEQKASKRAAAV